MGRSLVARLIALVLIVVACAVGITIDSGGIPSPVGIPIMVLLVAGIFGVLYWGRVPTVGGFPGD